MSTPITFHIDNTTPDKAQSQPARDISARTYANALRQLYWLERTYPVTDADGQRVAYERRRKVERRLRAALWAAIELPAPSTESETQNERIQGRRPGEVRNS